MLSTATRALLIAGILLASGCGSRAGLDDLAPGSYGSTGSSGTGSGGSSGSVGTMGCAAGSGAPVLLMAGPNPVLNLAVDATSVYSVDESGAVVKIPKCGGSATTIANAGSFSSSRVNSTTGLAVDSARVYVADSAGHLLGVPLSGGTPTTLVKTRGVVGVAVSGGDLYWLADPYYSPPPDYDVGSVPVQGGAPVTLTVSPQASQGPAVDHSSIYWVGWGVFSMPRAGGAVTTLAATQAPGAGIAIDSANVYWCATGPPTQEPVIMSTPKAGGPSVMLASDQCQEGQLATDGQNVYWANAASGAVMKVPVAGGSAVTVAAASNPGPIALDDTSVYWTQYWGSEGGGAAYSVMRLSPK